MITLTLDEPAEITLPFVPYGRKKRFTGDRLWHGVQLWVNVNHKPSKKQDRDEKYSKQMTLSHCEGRGSVPVPKQSIIS